MKHVVLENDIDLSDDMKRFLRDKDHEIIFQADQKDSDLYFEAFSKAEVIVFQPTEINWGQYNHLLMILYRMLQNGSLTVKEIHIVTNRHDIQTELKELWDDKREYLDQVLQRIKIFQYDRMEQKLLPITI